MKLLKSTSGKALLLILFIFSMVFGGKILEVVNNERTCVCAYDGYGYYMYLPYFFEHGKLDMTQEWAQQSQNKYCDGVYAYQIKQSKEGGELAVYHMGMAFVELPSYAVADVIARATGYETDGFSKPYHIAFLFNALLFTFLGLFYLRKLLLLFFSENTSALLILTTYLATNVFATFKFQYDLQHLYLLAINAAFLYYLFSFVKRNKPRHLLLSAILLGLTTCMRPTQVLWGIVPFFVLIKHFGHGKAFWKNILIYPILGIIWNIPQLLYWKIIGGQWFIPNMHTEDIALSDPNFIDFIFSYKKGWILYTPIFLMLTIGFYRLFRIDRNLFWGSLLFLMIYIYFMSSWECWWYASSFGSRVMVDIYPLLIILLGYFYTSLNSFPKKIYGITFVIGCVILNLFQTSQMEQGLLHSERMTKDHYWYIFGKSELPDYVDHHLEIDRKGTNFSWLETAKLYPDKYTIKEDTIFTITKGKRFEPGMNLTVTHINVLETLPSNESMLHVEIDAKTSDPNKFAKLQFETCSAYNCYDWKTIELSSGLSKDSIIHHELDFNIAHIRHQPDWIQIYIYAPEGVTIDIESMSIESRSLIRK